MRLSKTKAYIIGLLLLIIPFLVYNLIWLAGTKKVNATVIAINKASGSLGITANKRYTSTSTYPVYEYIVGDHIYRRAGHDNMPSKAGDTVTLRYKVSDPLKARLNTFWGLWLQVIIWSGVLILLWSMVFLHRKIIPPRSVIHISSAGIKIIPPER